MAHRTLALCALALVSLSACSKPDSGGDETTPLRVTSSSATVKANGTATVTIHAEGGAPGAVVVNTSLGAFTSGLKSITIEEGTPFSLPLRPCNSQLDAACAGEAIVSVVDSAATMRTAEVTFSQVERCSGLVDDDGDGRTDCADSDECAVGVTCAPFGKTCGADAACSVCNVPAGASAEANEQSCDDGHDNDCDGKVDCADSDCANDLCTTTTQVNGHDVLGVCKMTGTGAAQTGVCTCTPATGGESTPAACGNGLDDDCDGLVDCEDGTGTAAAPTAHCQPVGTALGKVCNLRGETCSVEMAPLPSTCSICGGNGGVAEPTESSCADSKDNDCDGVSDCRDTDCAAVGSVCDATGKQCTVAGTCVCQKSQAGGETSCGDGEDNDCDGLVDCADPSCKPPAGAPAGTLGVACNGFGSFCNSAGACICSGNGGPTAVESLLLCGDSRDNDCDGLKDCADVGCHPVGTGLGGDCDAGANMSGNYCSGLSLCVCSGNGGAPETPDELSCSDAKDNDCDAKVDCADTANCAGQSCNATGMLCSGTGTCSVCTGNGAPPEVTEQTCTDARDNDCDGKVDCADTDCATDVCNTGTQANGNPVMGVCTGTGAAATCKCTAAAGGETGALCANGKDDDCDGLVDCADGVGTATSATAHCQPVGNAAGQRCDTLGHTCSPPPVTGGVSICGFVCTPYNNGAPQPRGAETNCFDNADNDCDGKADCQDANCALNGLSCSTAGKTCSTTDFACDCRSAQSSGETNCEDRADNDCDNLIDCKDPSCRDITAKCGPNGFKCSSASGGTCACSGNGGVPQAQETTCFDNADNDCDGAKDCEDVDCRSDVIGEYGLACGDATKATLGFACDVLGACDCSNGQESEATCGDLVDNDCDGLLNCADPDCQPSGSNVAGESCSAAGKTCGADGACSVCTGNGGPAETAEATCYDGYDNDCNGQTDCDDPACQDHQCLATNAAYKCSPTGAINVCRDITQNYAITVTAASTRIAANGTSTTTVTATLKNVSGPSPVPAAAQAVSFALSGNGTLLSLGGTTNGNGQVTTTFRSSELGFPAIVTATYGSISGTVTIDQPTVAQVKLISMQWTVMGARFSTFQETNVLRFQVLDSLNVPYPRDLRVDFTHESKGKSFLGDTPSCDAATNVCSASAITDAQGFVTVTLRSGTIASPVAVLATATGGGASVQGDASQIAVVGAKASGAHLSLICTPQNVPGYAAHDCINSEYGGADNSITCTVALGDRFNNLLGKATLATFASEAGATGPPATTPAYDPSKTQTNLGRTTGYVAVTGYKLPVDVLPLDAAPPLDPATREYRLSYDDGMGCGTRIHNPRDGLSTIIVQVNGEEGFVDGNGNGTYDAGENFIDMAEPFVDADDSGDRTGTESFVDVNDNGRWDPPNREWDADTVIWAETRVLYSGLVTTHFIAPDHQISRFAATHVGLPAPTPTQPFQVWVKTDTSPAQGTSVYAYFADANFNPPTPRTSYALSTVGLVTAKWMTTPPTPGYSTGVGLSQLYCSTPTPTNISTECDAVSCNYAPCYVVTNIGAFNYGTGAYVRLDPKADPDPGAGLNATATFNGLGTSISVNGSSSVPSP